MDNVTHAMTGWTIARLLPAGDWGPWVVPCAIISANLPDFEILVVWPTDKPFYLSQHRGWSHSLLGVALEVLAMTLLVWLLGKWLARREQLPSPIPLFKLLLVNTLGAASHLLLDWWNTYGIRPLYPFNPEWIYGDFVFIIDPWVWLILGGTLLLGSRLKERNLWVTRGHLLFWTGLGLLVLGFTWGGLRSGIVPIGVPVLASWAVGGLAFWKWKQSPGFSPANITWSGCGLLLMYVAILFGSSRQAMKIGEQAYAESHFSERVINRSSNPCPGVPWRFEVVIETATEITQYSVDAWSKKVLRESRRDNNLNLPELKALEETREVKAWRSFARHPLVEKDGDALILGDARYQLFSNRDDWSAQRVQVR